VNPAYLLFEQVCREVDKAVVGMTDAKKVIFASVLAGGNVLLEGVPGLGKTLLARSFAAALGFYFRRVQFTPDLMPSDIIGTSVFNQANGRFEFVPGPVFTDFLLADEINRAPAKTQAALLEAMEEHQVTADNATYDLSSNFVVFATQNPVEFEGTYSLPEAQLDRFMIRIILGYPSEQEEDAILSSPADSISSRIPSINVISDSAALISEARMYVKSVTTDSRIVQYVRTLISLSRRSDHLLLGNSPRAGQMLLRLARAYAAIEGMDYVTPDHIRQLAPSVLPHRWVLKPEAEVQQTPVENILRSLFTTAKVPE
jgi:MoxR-like ATPase